MSAAALDLMHTQAPVDLLMPAMPQMITTAIYGVGAVIFVAYACVLAVRERTALPLLFILGAFLTIFLEPVVDILGNAVHPQIGQYHLLTTNGHPVPWAVFIGYVWYFAATPLLCWRMLVQRTMTQAFIWRVFAAVAVGAAIVEQIPLHYGVWVYYGEQPMKIGYMPLWWIFANTAAVLVPFIFIYKLFPRLTGLRQWLVVGLVPCGAFMGHAGAGWPMYNALGTNTETLSPVLLHIASAGSIAASLLIVWVAMNVADIATRASLSSPRSSAASMGGLRAH